VLRATWRKLDDRSTTRDFLHRRPDGRDHGRPAGHRLEHGQPEALVERRVEDAASSAVQRGELGVRDLADPTGDLDTAPPACAHHAQLDTGNRAASTTLRFFPLCCDGETYCRPQGRRANTESTPFGTTRMRSASTPVSSTVSPFVNSETATIASAACSTRTSPAFP
jgi:hypothetical protein